MRLTMVPKASLNDSYFYRIQANNRGYTILINKVLLIMCSAGAVILQKRIVKNVSGWGFGGNIITVLPLPVSSWRAGCWSRCESGLLRLWKYQLFCLFCVWNLLSPDGRAMKGPVLREDEAQRWRFLTVKISLSVQTVRGRCQELEDSLLVPRFFTGGIYGLRLHRADRSALSPQSSRGMLLILPAWAVHLSPLWSRISSSFPFFFLPSESSGFLFSRSGAYHSFLHRCPPFPPPPPPLREWKDIFFGGGGEKDLVSPGQIPKECGLSLVSLCLKIRGFCARSPLSPFSGG